MKSQLLLFTIVFSNIALGNEPLRESAVLERSTLEHQKKVHYKMK